MIKWDEIIEQTKTVPTKFNEKKVDPQNFCLLLAFLLITIALLITISIYCYLIKYWAKQKHLFPFHDTNNKLKKFCVNNILLKNGNKNELKEIDIKNYTCYYFDDTIKIEEFDINNILIDEKPCKNILVYKISHKSWNDSKP